MNDFVGRRGYRETLETELVRVRQTGHGRLVFMWGRRRVSKSRLVDEFPYIVEQDPSLEATLQRALEVLVGQKRMVSAERPLSSRPSREMHYAVADPYLRFWLRFVGPNMAEIERNRGDLVGAKIREGWPA